MAVANKAPTKAKPRARTLAQHISTQDSVGPARSTGSTTAKGQPFTRTVTDPSGHRRKCSEPVLTHAPSAPTSRPQRADPGELAPGGSDLMAGSSVFVDILEGKRGAGGQTVRTKTSPVGGLDLPPPASPVSGNSPTTAGSMSPRNSPGSSPRRVRPVLRTEERARKLKEKDMALGAHYRAVPGELPGSEGLLWEKSVHDKIFAATGQSSPRSPGINMRTAFTDRSVRMHEGALTRSLFTHDGHATTEWGEKSDCPCVVCKPEQTVAAGVGSRQLTLGQARSRVKNPSTVGGQKAPSTRMYSSEGTSMCLVQSNHDPKTDVPSVKEESEFQKNMGRKARSRSPSPSTAASPEGLCVFESRPFGLGVQRSRSADCLQPAGAYDVDHRSGTELYGWSRRGFRAPSPNRPQRSGVALVLSPRAGDPPPPTKILPDRRGSGMFKHKLSAESALFTDLQNPDVMRFASPTSPRRLIGRPEIDPDHAGLSTRAIDAREGFLTSNRPRTGMNTSDRMSAALDHAATRRSAEQQAADRRQHESAFSAACESTRALRLENAALAREVKHFNGKHRSEQVRAHLEWPGAR